MKKESVEIIDALTLFILIRCCKLYKSAIEKIYLSYRNEFNKVYFLRFCTKYDTWFSKYGIELIVALSSTWHLDFS